MSLGVDTALEDPDTFRLVADDYTRIGEGVAGLALPDTGRSKKAATASTCSGAMWRVCCNALA